MWKTSSKKILLFKDYYISKLHGILYDMQTYLKYRNKTATKTKTKQNIKTKDFREAGKMTINTKYLHKLLNTYLVKRRVRKD